MESLGARHIRIYTSEKSRRAALSDYWQELMYYCLPRKAYITKIKNIGDKFPSDIYDSTAIVANAYFAAGMQAYISGPQTKWFDIVVTDRALMNNRDVLDYLSDTKDVLYDMVNNSNFYQEDVEGYLCLGSIGTDILYAEEDAEEDIRFESINIENAVPFANAKGIVDTIYLEYEFTAIQAVEKFGAIVDTKVHQAFETLKYDQKFRYLFCVTPRGVYDRSKKDAKNMPFASYWVEWDTQKVIVERGYNEFPFYLSRFSKSKGDCYGCSPAMNIFADIKMVNAMELTNIQGAQLSVRPPLEIPDEAFVRPYNFNPGGKNIKNAGYPNEHITPVVTGSNVRIGLDYVQYKQARIQQAFYNDLFLALEKIGDMTATEVMVRNNQRMQLLGSAIGNIMREKLSPVIERTYAIAARFKKLPKIPGVMMKNPYYQIVYVSPLARAQKALELQNVNQAMSIIGSVAPVNPEVLDKIDFDEFVNYVAEVTNITPKIIRDDVEVAAIREGKARQQAMTQQMLALQQGAETVKTGAEADRTIAESQQPAMIGK